MHFTLDQTGVLFGSPGTWGLTSLVSVQTHLARHEGRDKVGEEIFTASVMIIAMVPVAERKKKCK